MKSKIDRYLRQTKRCLIFCPRKRRAAFLGNLRGDMEAFFQEDPQASWAEAEKAFGTPMEVAESFFKEVPFEEAVRAFRLRQRIFRLVCVVVIALAMVIAILGTIYVVEAYNYAHGEWIEGPAIEDPYDEPFSIPTDDGAIAVYRD